VATYHLPNSMDLKPGQTVTLIGHELDGIQTGDEIRFGFAIAPEDTAGNRHQRRAAWAKSCKRAR
jgi:hypothetical protein